MITAFRRALVVDGDQVWRAATTRMLQRFGVGDVLSTHTIESAQRIVREGIDLLVSEVVIAHQRCYPLLREASSLGRRVAIVAVSDMASRSQVFRLRDYGVDAYLEKPIDPELLRRALDALAEGRKLSEARASFVGVRAFGAGRLMDETLDGFRSRYGLTGAELDVLRCAVAGLNRSDIARERRISTNTVKTQVRALLGKCGHSTLHALVLDVCARVQDADLASYHSPSPASHQTQV